MVDRHTVTATVGADKDGRLFTLPGGAPAVRLEYRTLSPASNYTAEFYIEPSGGQVDGVAFIALRDSSTGRLITFEWDTEGTTQQLRASKWTSPTSYSAAYATRSVFQLAQRFPNWMRFRDNGTTRFFEFSYNGVNWSTLHSVGRTDFCTPDQIGWGGFSDMSATETIRLRSWSIV